MNAGFRCGYIALVGKPNTGKSTLMNALVGEKLSITAHRPQTTRHQILGIKTTEAYQCIFVDTPGMHDSRHKVIHRYMNRAAANMLKDSDLNCVLIEVNHFTRHDMKILNRVADYPNRLVVLNKIDQVSRHACLPVMQQIAEHLPNTDIIPISAQTGENLDQLEALMVSRLPQAIARFPDDQLTDKSMRFIAAEAVREKLFRELSQELPYSITVNVDHYVEEVDVIRISATIWVERESQKSIVIGRGGKVLKKIGTLARGDLERLTGTQVYLQLWVKVREDWSDDEQSLAAFGYADVVQGQ